ncbi:MAG: hypothetical protein RL346_1172 [Verrucomicrobiota bacterium]|jgi:hypothetical protein
MKCPRCVQRIHRAAASCPHCGFSISDADLLFGGQPLHLKSVNDVAGLFRLQERDRLVEKLQRLRRLFPELFVSIYTGNLNHAGQVRQLGFWLLNRGVFRDTPAHIPNDNGVILVIDPDSRMAGLTFGYRLEPYVGEEESFDCLARAHAHWLHGRYADGVLQVINELQKLLKKRSRDVRKHGLQAGIGKGNAT